MIRGLIHTLALAGHSVGRDIPGMTHGTHLRLVEDETSLFINVGRRVRAVGAVSSLLSGFGWKRAETRQARADGLIDISGSNVFGFVRQS